MEVDGLAHALVFYFRVLLADLVGCVCDFDFIEPEEVRVFLFFDVPVRAYLFTLADDLEWIPLHFF